MDEECKKKNKPRKKRKKTHATVFLPKKKLNCKNALFLKKQNPMEKLEKAFIYLTRLTMLSSSIFKGFKKDYLLLLNLSKKFWGLQYTTTGIFDKIETT